MGEGRGEIAANTLRDLAADAARLAAPVFKAKRHEWDGCGVPDEADIAATLAGLIDSAGKLDGGSFSTGGFHVHHCFENGQEIYEVSLKLGSVVGEAVGTRG